MSSEELTIESDSDLQELKKDMVKLTKIFQKKYRKKTSNNMLRSHSKSSKTEKTDNERSRKFDEK